MPITRYYLCGGIFFFLLLQAKKQNCKSRNRNNNGSDNLTEPAVLQGLIYAVIGNDFVPYEASFKKNTSEYKQCKINGSTYIPFNDVVTIKTYDQIVKADYSVATERMNEFIERYIDENKQLWLVKMLLGIIKRDDIDDDFSFYIKQDVSSIFKHDMDDCSRFNLSPFLVGIMHFILLNRSDNAPGKDIVEQWQNQPETLNEPINIFNRDIYVFRKNNLREYSSSEHNENTKNTNENTENTEADIFDNKSEFHEKTQKHLTMNIIRQQTNVAQYGEKSVNLVNNGTINISL